MLIACGYEHQNSCGDFESLCRKDASVKPENRELAENRCEKPCKAGTQQYL